MSIGGCDERYVEPRRSSSHPRQCLCGHHIYKAVSVDLTNSGRDIKVQLTLITLIRIGIQIGIQINVDHV